MAVAVNPARPDSPALCLAGPMHNEPRHSESLHGETRHSGSQHGDARQRDFRQIDVFGDGELAGNPVAVVHDADGLTTEQMQAMARWTNLSETTFLLPPTVADADYRLRIFTPGAELPFAGHPTLGSAHAWLDAGGVPAVAGTLIQECGAGLVTLRQDDLLAFAAPPPIRWGAVSDAESKALLAALRVRPEQVLATQWVDNGPGWVGVLMDSADTVLGLEPDWTAMGDLKIGVVGRYSEQQTSEVGAAVEVRAFCPGIGVVEDPVTGSLNASLGQWLTGEGILPAAYVASQGTRLGRRGRVHITRDGGEVWVAGATTTVVAGRVTLS